MKPRAREWNLGFRPDSYWDPRDPLTALTQNVTGELRRQMIGDIVTRKVQQQAAELYGADSGAEALFEEVDPGLLADVLDEAGRVALGRIHPQFMGGEYLPPYRRHEVEIARIVLDSTTMDVMSVRARRSRDRRIHYRVVDEYQTDFDWRPKSSKEPLTLGQLVGLIDSLDDGNDYGAATYIDAIRNFNVSDLDDVERMIGFVTVTSPVYPELERCYAARAEAWAARWREQLKEV